MTLGTIESLLGSIWFGIAAFAAGVLLADVIKAGIKRIFRG
jgi:hypothetical protein